MYLCYRHPDSVRRCPNLAQDCILVRLQIKLTLLTKFASLNNNQHLNNVMKTKLMMLKLILQTGFDTISLICLVFTCKSIGSSHLQIGVQYEHPPYHMGIVVLTAMALETIVSTILIYVMCTQSHLILPHLWYVVSLTIQSNLMLTYNLLP